MSYEVTATRRRPQAFEALAGQEFVAETLKNSIESKKIAHAYLFTGPRGCGKTSTARILAKALNCENGPTATPCGKCQHCLEITKGQSTDVIEIDGASNTSINDVRQIKDEVLFPPQSARYKIYIIDEVHMISNQAFNALLKTIEEPPPYCVFIFATTELHKVPMTIKSRCQQFNFRLVPIETVKEQLAMAAAEIGIKAEDEALYWVARESTGSMRDAYTLFDQVAAFSGDSITYDKIRDKLGLVGVERLNSVFEDCVQNKTQEALLKIDSFLQNGISIEQFISNCTDYLRSILLIKAGITKEALLGQASERYSQAVISSWNPIQLERALSILMQLYRDIRYSISPRYELELAFSRLSWLTQYVSPAEVKKAIDEAKALLGTVPLTATSQQVQSVHNQAPQIQQTQNPQQNAASNPYVQRQQNIQPKPANIFASGAAAVSAQQEQIQQNPSRMPFKTFSALSSAPQSPQIEEDFAPPDPTPESAPSPATSDSFSYGGAVPPEKTAGAVFDEPQDLRGRAIKELAMHEPMLGSSLYQTGAWTKSGNTVSTTVQSTYLKMQLDSNTRKISEYLSNFLGEQITFSVSLLQQHTVNIEENAPQEIKMLCGVFKGQIVGHSKKTEEEIKKDAESKNSQKTENSEDSDEASTYDTSSDESEA